MGVSEGKIGYIFGLGCLVYALTAPFVGIICRIWKAMYITQSAFVLCTVSLFIFGPSKILHFPDSLSLVIVGCGLSGASVAFIFVPLLSEIILAVNEKERIDGDN